MAQLRQGIGSMLSGEAAGMVFVQLDGETTTGYRILFLEILF